MYESTFQLSRRPFVAMPSADQYFAAQSIENARTAIVRLIDRYEGPAMVIGPVGTGKSLLSQVLADYFRSQCRVALIPSGRICTRRTLLQVLLHDLGLAYQGMEEGELRLSLIDHLTSLDFCPNGTLLMIDEADALPMALLDELRTMTNLVANGQPCIRLVLFGSPRLEEKFTHPRLESFNQRLAGRFYLEPLNRNETLEYIVTQFDECGGDSALAFSNESLEAIYRATNGVPRMINQLTDHTLILATADGKTFIDQDLVNAAWSDLQQLPAPTPVSFGPSIGADHIIEFGELDAIDASEPHDSDASQLADDSSLQNPMATIDEMQRQLTELESDETLPSAESVVEDLPQADPVDQIEETSIHLHEAIDPFADSFEEEEAIVVNRTSATSTETTSAESMRTEMISGETTCADEAVYDESSPLVDSHQEGDSTGQVEPNDADLAESSAAQLSSGMPNTDASTDGWDEEFDPSTDPVIPEGFHEFIVDSDSSASSHDCSQDSNELPEWNGEQTTLPEVVEISPSESGHGCGSCPSGGCHSADEEQPDSQDAQDLELKIVTGLVAPSPADASGPEEAEKRSVPGEFLVDGMSDIPEFVIPELTEADGVVMSMPSSTFAQPVEDVGVPETPTVEEGSSVEVDALEEASVEPHSASQESSQDELELKLVKANSVGEPQAAATSDVDSVEEVTPAEDATESDTAATCAVDGVQHESDEGIVVDDKTLPLVEPLAAASPIEPQDQSPALDESQSSYPAEPAVRNSSPKRFNRLFSKMQSK